MQYEAVEGDGFAKGVGNQVPGPPARECGRVIRLGKQGLLRRFNQLSPQQKYHYDGAHRQQREHLEQENIRRDVRRDNLRHHRIKHDAHQKCALNYLHHPARSFHD
jgi:hypothetical protein